MNRFKILLIALASISFFATDASAQLFRGGLIRKALGRDDEDKEEKEKEKQRKKAEEEAKAQRMREAGYGQNAGYNPANQFSRMKMFDVELSQPRADSPISIKSASRKGDGYAAGLRQGDELLSVAGMSIDSLQMLNGFDKSLSTGDRFDIEVQRKGKSQTIEFVFNHQEAADLETQPAPIQANPDANEGSSLLQPEALTAPAEELPSLSDPLPAPSILRNQETSDISPTEKMQIDSLLRIVREQQAIIERQADEIRRLKSQK